MRDKVYDIYFAEIQVISFLHTQDGTKDVELKIYLERIENIIDKIIRPKDQEKVLLI